jgi:hypothetical protein
MSWLWAVRGNIDMTRPAQASDSEVGKLRTHLPVPEAILLVSVLLGSWGCALLFPWSVLSPFRPIVGIGWRRYSVLLWNRLLGSESHGTVQLGLSLPQI